jgi:magnesium chelatase family protein
MDRIEMVVDVWRSDAAHVLNTGKGTSSAHLREGVMRARAFAIWREARAEAQGLLPATEEQRKSAKDTGLADAERLCQAAAGGVEASLE